MIFKSIILLITFIVYEYYISFQNIKSFTHLREFTLFVYKSHNIHWFHCNHIQGFLIINKLNVCPFDLFIVVFFLFQFEYVTHEELLQVLVRIVNAHLFKTKQETWVKNTRFYPNLLSVPKQ